VNFVPLPSSLWKASVPFIAVKSSLRTANPNPYPLDLVVNSVWKRLPLACSGIPMRVSSTVKIAVISFEKSGRKPDG